MLLTCDVGNTSIKLVVYKGNERVAYYRLYNDIHLDFEEEIFDFLNKENIMIEDIEDSIVSSVVPAITELLCSGIENVIGKKAIVIDGHNFYGIKLSEDVQEEVGSDLLVMSAYAYQRYKKE
ncbi:MAG: type III pantothenate kinase, partial [Erysipelotrichaceae bacterium]|nr:type III pantothenate kinase [Erysipelotrichaceae bacterium]